MDEPLSDGSVMAEHQSGDRHSENQRGNVRDAVLIGLAGLIIACGRSWSPSLWTDESATISAARRSLGQLWRMVGNLDLVHGAYYFFMHFWVELFGISPFALRFPSAVAIGIATGCVYTLGSRARGRSFGLISGAVFAVLPRVFWAGTEARSFAFTAALTAGAALLLNSALRSPRKTKWVGYTVLLLLGILANLFVGLLIVAHAVSMWWDRSITVRQRLYWLCAAGAAGIVAIPFAVWAAQQSSQLGDRRFGVRDLLQNFIVNQWFLGDTPTTTTGVAQSTLSLGDVGSWWIPASIVLAAVGWLLMASATVGGLRSTIRDSKGARSTMIWTVPWILIPPAVIGLYSLVGTPMYSPRYLTFAAPAVALLMASGLWTLRSGRLRIAVLVAMVVIAVPVYGSQRQLYGKNGTDWASAAEFMRSHAKSGQGVYFAPRYDVTGETVGQTTRGMLTAYPRAFVGLIDVTLITSGADANNLTGISRRLQASTATVKTMNVLWMVRRIDYPADEASADGKFLVAQGFHSAIAWVGPLDEIIRFERTTA